MFDYLRGDIVKQVSPTNFDDAAPGSMRSQCEPKSRSKVQPMWTILDSSGNSTYLPGIPARTAPHALQKVQLPDDLPIELCRAARRRNPNYKYARTVIAPLFCWTGRCRVVLSNARVLVRGGPWLSLRERDVQRVEYRFEHISNDRFRAGLDMGLQHHSWRNRIIRRARAHLIL